MEMWIFLASKGRRPPCPEVSSSNSHNRKP
jgi:hypothetical protein